MFPWFAYVVVFFALGTSAVVWTLSARLRARGSEAPLAPVRTMMGRGLFVPTAMIFIAADFAHTPVEWLLWIGLVFGSWMATLFVVRGTILATLGAATVVSPVSSTATPANAQELVAEGAA